MGFFDKIAKGVSGVVGAGGNIDLSLNKDTFQRGEPVEFQFTINATNDVKARAVKVRLSAEEHVQVQFQDRQEGSSSYQTRTEEQWEETFKQEVQVGGAMELKEGESYDFSGSINIPPDAPPTYRGRNANHTWKFRAYVDKGGADIGADQEIFVT
jgi:hypothetical protein